MPTRAATALTDRGSRKSRLETNLDRPRKDASLEDIGKLAELAPRRGQRGVGRDVVGLRDLGKLLDVAHRRDDRFDGSCVGNEGADLDSRLDLAKGVPDVDGDQSEQTEREQRKGDRDDAERAEERCAADGQEDFA